MKLFSKLHKQGLKSTDKDYPIVDTATIEEIHNEFRTAGDKLYEEAMQILQGTKILNEEKIKRLKVMGFGNSREVTESSEIINMRESKRVEAKTIQYYKEKYPLLKFITEESITNICNKYKLVRGGIGMYIGFVPEKNLKEIESFSIDVEDLPHYIYHPGFGPFETTDREIISRHYKSRKNISTNPVQSASEAFKEGDLISIKEFYIAAPEKDFKVDSRYLINADRQLVFTHPDPVVFIRVINGFLIVTAWGAEASDPLVINEINN